MGPLLPAERQVRGGDDLDKVHVVEVGVHGGLDDAVERVDMVVRPGHVLVLVAKLFEGGGRQLRSEAQRVDGVAERVAALNGSVPVVLEVMDVHVAVAETATGGEVEVADDLVDAQAASDLASLVALLVQALGVVLARALLDVLAAAKGPRCLGVRLTHLVTRVTTAGLLGVGRGRGAVAAAAVVGVQMRSSLVLGVESQGLGVDDTATFGLGSEADLDDTVLHAVLLLARDVHHIEGQELAGHPWECYVEVDFHAVSWGVEELYMSANSKRQFVEAHLSNGTQTSALVNNQLRVYVYPAVVCPFSPGQVQDHDQ